MAILKIVPEEHWFVLKKYLAVDDSGIILVPEEIVAQMSGERAARLRALAGNGYVNYDFGGEADLLVDTALHPDAYAIQELLGVEEEEDSD